MTTTGPFDDILAANAARGGAPADLEARPAMRLAALTCMDSRVDPVRVLGLEPGDANVMRNAGARVTEDVLRSLVVAHHLLGVTRFMVIGHTRCAMVSESDESVHAAIAARGGADTRTLRFLTIPDQDTVLGEDVERVRTSPFLADLIVGGFVYDLGTGRLRPVC